MNQIKVISFLLLAFVLSWVSYHLAGMFLDPEGMATPFIKLLAYAWGPGLSALIVQKWVYKESMARYGWNRRRFNWQWILGMMYLPLGIVAATVGIAFVLGNFMHIPGFGDVVMGGPELKVAALAVLPGFIHNWFIAPMMSPEGWMLAGLIIALGPVAGALINLFFNIGEELGWRGFMLAETRSLGFVKSNLLIGLSWGLWSLPLLFLGQSNGASFLAEDLLIGILIHVGFCMSMAFPMAYFSSKTRSIYASATFHGSLNNVASLTGFFILGANPYLASVYGLTGMTIFLAITLLIMRMDPDFERNYKELFY
ncbi:MAG: CPBP family glutamic-type intramembrane protease [Bacteroidota bacterium]